MKRRIRNKEYRIIEYRSRRQETGDGLRKCCGGPGFPLSGDQGVSEGKKRLGKRRKAKGERRKGKGREEYRISNIEVGDGRQEKGDRRRTCKCCGGPGFPLSGDPHKFMSLQGYLPAWIFLNKFNNGRHHCRIYTPFGLEIKDTVLRYQT